VRLSLNILVCATLALCSSVATAQTKLRAWNIHPDGYPVSDALKSFAEQVGKSTGGRYSIEVFNNASLGDQPKAVQMVKTGEIDIAEFSSGPLSEAAPGLKALNLPFLFTDSTHMFKHLDGKLGKRFAERLKGSGFVVLGWYDGGARSFYCSHKPITSMRDLANAKIRVQQSEVYIEMVKLLGATPAALPYKDVLEALQTNKVDCAENNMPSYESTGHYKAAKYVFMTNHVISPEALVVSTKLWDKLTPQDQAAFSEAGAKSALLMRELWNKRVTQAREVAVKGGAQFHKVSDLSSMLKKMTPLYQKYLADPQTREELLTILAVQ